MAIPRDEQHVITDECRFRLGLYSQKNVIMMTGCFRIR